MMNRWGVGVATTRAGSSFITLHAKEDGLMGMTPACMVLGEVPLYVVMNW
jgi:hypothetical protein